MCGVQYIFVRQNFAKVCLNICLIFISLYWLMMVATLQLKAPKLIVYFVSFTVVIFTILNDYLINCVYIAFVHGLYSICVLHIPKNFPRRTTWFLGRTYSILGKLKDSFGMVLELWGGGFH